MTFSEIYHGFITGLQQSSWLEIIAAICGIISVWFSKKENILVYPVGLINTIIYVYISFKYHLPGEASVNFYYTIMSFYGWYNWNKKDSIEKPLVRITYSDKRMLQQQVIFFLSFFIVLFFALTKLKEQFFPGAIPWADALASAAAFTGMWMMTRKKVESWYWWLITNAFSIPLYFVKGLMITSVYYFILLILAVFGLSEWKQKARTAHD